MSDDNCDIPHYTPSESDVTTFMNDHNYIIQFTIYEEVGIIQVFPGSDYNSIKVVLLPNIDCTTHSDIKVSRVITKVIFKLLDILRTQPVYASRIFCCKRNDTPIFRTILTIFLNLLQSRVHMYSTPEIQFAITYNENMYSVPLHGNVSLGKIMLTIKEY